METTARSEDAVVLATAWAAREIAGLPGAPTPDWTGRLARVLTDADPLTAAEVVVAGAPSARFECLGTSIGADAGAAGLACAADLRRLVRHAPEVLGAPPGGVQGAGEWIDAEASAPRIRAALRRRPDALLAWTPLRREHDAPRRDLILIWDGAMPDSRFTPCERKRMLVALLPIITDRLAHALAGTVGRPSWLSVCEQRVLELLASGLSVPEVADRLGRSQHTIHDHVKRLHRKLGTRSRGSLIARTLSVADTPHDRTSLPRRGLADQPSDPGLEPLVAPDWNEVA